MLAIALTLGAGVQYLSEEPDNPSRLLPVSGTALPLVWRRRYPLAAYQVSGRNPFDQRLTKDELAGC